MTRQFCGAALLASALFPSLTHGAQAFSAALAIGDTQTFSFTYAAGDRIIATLVDAEDTNFSPNLELFAPDGTPLVDLAQADSVSVNMVAETAGNYSIRVSDDANDTAGVFRLDVSRLPSSNDGGTLNNGSELTDSFVLGEVRAYQFSATAGDVVIATANDALQSGTLRPLLEVYAPDGSLLNRSSGDNTAASVLRVDQSGTFTLVASDDGYDVAGDLRIDLSVINGVADGGVVNPGTTITDSLLRGQVLGYTFVASAGDHLVATLNDTQLAGNFSPRLLVFAPSGEVLLDDSNAITAVANQPLTESGTYNVIVADSAFTAPGDFRLDLSLAIATNDGGTIADGASVSENLSLGEVVFYQFNATAGQRIDAMASDLDGDPSFRPRLELFSPTGEQLSRDTDGASAHADVIASQTGSYSLMVAEESYDVSGSVRLDLSVGAAPPPIVGGQAQEVIGSLGIGETDSFTVQALAGDQLVITVADNSNPGFSTSSTFIEILAPDNSPLASDSDTSTAFVNLTAPTAGTYTVNVSEVNRDVAIDYRLDITRVFGANDGGTLVNGNPVVDSFLLGEVLAYQFDASAGDHLVATLADNSGPGFSSTSARLELYAPDGTRLIASTSTSTAVANLMLEQSGTFTLLASEDNYDQVMDFRLDFSLVPTVNDGGSLTNGVPVVGTLLLGEVRAFQFDATAGDRIVATFADSVSPGFSDSVPNLELYAPDGTQLATDIDSSTAFVNLTVHETGTYTLLLAEGSYDQALNFRLDFSRVPDINDGGDLTSGIPVVSTLLLGEVRGYQFDAVAGERIVATLADTSSPGFSDSVPNLELYGPDGAQLITDIDSSAASMNVLVEKTGTYTLLVGEQSYDQALDFRLDFSRVPSANDGGTLTNGVPVVDALLLGEVLAYQFEGVVGDRIVATLADSASTAGSPYLELYSPDGTRIATSDDSVTAVLNLNLDQSGTFTLLVAELSYDTAYSFRLDLSLVPRVNDGGVIAGGVPVVDSLLLGEVLAYQFDVSAGTRVTATLDDNTGSPRAYLELYGPDGIRIATAAGNVTAVVDNFVGQSGTFTLLVAEDGYDQAMDFRLELVTTAASDAGVLNDGDVRRNTLLTGEVVIYSFDAMAGDRIVVALSETINSFAYSPRLLLASPDGTFIVDQAENALVSTGLIAPRSGTYVLFVTENGLDSGYEYEVALAVGGENLDGFPLNDGAVVAGPLVAGDVLSYTFSANAGDSVIATLVETGLPVGASPRLQLVTPSGATINNPSALFPSQFAPNHVHLTLGESGTYTLLASENGLNASFNFRLEFARIPGANDGGTIVNDSPITGSIDSGELIAYRFQASTGDTVSVRFLETLAAASFVPFIELYAPDGTLLALDVDNTVAEFDLLLETSGTYTLVVASLSNQSYRGAGQFSLSLSGATIPDTDGDGVPDISDNCPTGSNSNQLNTDGDSLGNVCDPDDDNDGLLDSEEATLGTNPLLVDTDGDGFSDAEEIDFGTNPLDASDTPSISSGLPIWLLYEATQP